VLLLDILAVVAAVGLGGAGLTASIALLRSRASAKRERDREHGRQNAKDVEREEASRCQSCGEPTSPDRDVFVAPSWYHRHCYSAVLRIGE